MGNPEISFEDLMLCLLPIQDNYKENGSKSSYLKYIFDHYNPSVRITELFSNTTYVACQFHTTVAGSTA